MLTKLEKKAEAATRKLRAVAETGEQWAEISAIESRIMAGKPDARKPHVERVGGAPHYVSVETMAGQDPLRLSFQIRCF